MCCLLLKTGMLLLTIFLGDPVGPSCCRTYNKIQENCRWGPKLAEYTRNRRGRWSRLAWQKDEGQYRCKAAGKANRMLPAADVVSWPAGGGMEEASPSHKKKKKNTDSLLQCRIIHSVSSLSTAQFSEKGSTRADYCSYSCYYLCRDQLLFTFIPLALQKGLFVFFS